jgi:hypothetical protein
VASWADLPNAEQFDEKIIGEAGEKHLTNDVDGSPVASPSFSRAYVVVGVHLDDLTSHLSGEEVMGKFEAIVPQTRWMSNTLDVAACSHGVCRWVASRRNFTQVDSDEWLSFQHRTNICKYLGHHTTQPLSGVLSAY